MKRILLKNNHKNLLRRNVAVLDLVLVDQERSFNQSQSKKFLLKNQHKKNLSWKNHQLRNKEAVIVQALEENQRIENYLLNQLRKNLFQNQ